MPRSRKRRLPLFAALSVCCSCGPSGVPTAVQLVLFPDPELCTAADIIANVETIYVIVDAASGLDGVLEAGQTRGGGVAQDFDGDGQLEVRFQAPPLSGPDLPLLQVDLKANVGKELAFRVYGMPPGAPLELERAVAFGGASASCVAGQVCKVATPFNLRAAARPPRVILVMPADGSTDVLDSIVAVSVVLSTTVKADSARANARVLGTGGSVKSLAVIVGDVAFTQGGETAKRASLTFQLAPPLPAGSYAIEVGPGIVSAAGKRFDQDPATPSEDGFKSTFVVSLANATSGCSCEKGYVCNVQLQGCQPAPDCSKGCPDGFVCDPAQQACVEDCRRFGACASAASICGEDGLCR